MAIVSQPSSLCGLAHLPATRSYAQALRSWARGDYASLGGPAACPAQAPVASAAIQCCVNDNPLSFVFAESALTLPTGELYQQALLDTTNQPARLLVWALLNANHCVASPIEVATAIQRQWALRERLEAGDNTITAENLAADNEILLRYSTGDLAHLGGPCACSATPDCTSEQRALAPARGAPLHPIASIETNANTTTNHSSNDSANVGLIMGLVVVASAGFACLCLGVGVLVFAAIAYIVQRRRAQFERVGEFDPSLVRSDAAL